MGRIIGVLVHDFPTFPRPEGPALEDLGGVELGRLPSGAFQDEEWRVAFGCRT